MGEVAGLGNLDVRLVDELAHLIGGDGDQLGAHRLQLNPQPVQRGGAFLGRGRGPALPRGDGGLQHLVESFGGFQGALRHGAAAEFGCGQRLADGICPPLVAEQRGVGVGGVGEHGRRFAAFLDRPGGRGGGADQCDGVAVASFLLVEEGDVAAEGGRPGHEVLRCGVLLQAPHQVGDRGVELAARHHGNVEPQRTHFVEDHPLQRHRHARQHLDVETRRDAAGLRQLDGGGEAVDVVAGRTDVEGLDGFGGQEPVEGAEVAGVGLDLRRQDRVRPAAQLRLGAFHRQVGALDQAHPQRNATRFAAAPRQFLDVLDHQRRLAQVGLDRQAHPQLRQFHGEPLEHLKGEVEVAVLLHVEVDELARPVRGLHQRAETNHGLLHRRVVGPRRVGTHHRGHLDGDVIDVGPVEKLDGAVEPGGGVLVAQHGLTQKVDVQARAALAQPGQRWPEVAADVDHEVAQQQGKGAPPRGQHCPGCGGDAETEAGTQVGG